MTCANALFEHLVRLNILPVQIVPTVHRLIVAWVLGLQWGFQIAQTLTETVLVGR